MMLRALVAVLLLANLGFWAWSEGLFSGLGWGPTQQRDPSRLARQLRADSVRVLPPDAVTSSRGAAPAAAAATASGVSAAAACLEAGPFSATAADDAERALAAAGLPPGRWQRIRQDVAAQYGVVLGPFNSRESVQLKREELGRLRVTGEDVALASEGAGGAAGRPGLALARFDTQAGAEAALAGFNQRGVRTARVALLRPAGTQTRLRVDGAAPTLAAQLRALSGPLWAGGFGACEAAR